MADLIITAASVQPGTDATTGVGTAGEALTAGQAVYRRSSDGKLYLASASNANAAADSLVIGIVGQNAAAGQPAVFVNGGQLAIGATVVVGQVYVLSANAGGIAPVSDLVAGNYTTLIGVADTTTTILLDSGFLANQAQHG